MSSANYTIDRSRVTLIDFPSARALISNDDRHGESCLSILLSPCIHLWLRAIDSTRRKTSLEKFVTRALKTPGARDTYVSWKKNDFRVRAVPPGKNNTRCIKLCRPRRVRRFRDVDNGRAPRVTPHGTRGREEKWRVLAASRREKRGRAFLRKVGREGIRLYTTRRSAPGDARARERRRRRSRPAAATASLSKSMRVVGPLSHVTVFRRCCADTDRRTKNSTFSVTATRCVETACCAARPQLAEASIR